MRAETFYAFGYALGLTEDGMTGLLGGRLEPPQIDEINGGFVKVTVRGCDAAAIVKGSHMRKWMKELNRLRNEEQR